MLHRSRLPSGGVALIAEITNADCIFVAERSCGLRCTLCCVPCARLALEFRRRALHQPHDPGKAADGAKKSAVVGVALTVLADVRKRRHWGTYADTPLFSPDTPISTRDTPCHVQLRTGTVITRNE